MSEINYFVESLLFQIVFPLQLIFSLLESVSNKIIADNFFQYEPNNALCIVYTHVNKSKRKKIFL